MNELTGYCTSVMRKTFFGVQHKRQILLQEMGYAAIVENRQQMRYCLAEEGAPTEVNEDFICGTGVNLIPYLLEQKHFFY